MPIVQLKSTCFAFTNNLECILHCSYADNNCLRHDWPVNVTSDWLVRRHNHNLRECRSGDVLTSLQFSTNGYWEGTRFWYELRIYGELLELE